MEGPGMSLFQGASSIHVNNSAQERLEEQEELEDQKRRNAELKQQLDNAFGDLSQDDDASSVNSSANFTMDGQPTNGEHRIKDLQKVMPHNLPTYVDHLKEQQQHGTPKPYHETPSAQHLPHHVQQDKYYTPYGAGDCQNNYFQDLRGQLNGINHVEANHFLKQDSELKIMYEMRVKECSQLASQLQEVQAASEKEVEVLNARLHAAFSDRDKAVLSLQQAQQLLESSKHQIVDREQRLSALEEQLARCQRDGEQARLELRAAGGALQEAQQRLHSLQVAQSHDTDNLFREHQDRHAEEVNRLHSDLEKVRQRLEDKENEIKRLERQCKDKDGLLIEKSSIVNSLAKELKEAQNVFASGGGEVARLKERLAALSAERNAAKDQVKEFGSKLEVTAHELVLTRNKLAAAAQELDGWRPALRLLAECAPDAWAGEPSSPGKLATLKDVLSRYKQQMQKITALQDEISKRDKKLEHHRKTESELKARLEEHKAIETQLASKAALLQNKLELLDSRGEAELLDRYREREQALREGEEQARAESKHWELKYTELEMDYEKLKSERGDRANLVQEANADLLKELEKYSAQLKDTLKQNVELKTLYLQACSSRDAVSREIKDIQTKLQREKEQQKNKDKDSVERLEKERQSNEKLKEELAVCKEEMELAKKRVLELQKELTEKQRDFTNKLDEYLQDEKSSLRKELASCAQCELHLRTIRSLEEQIERFSSKLATQGSNEELMQELRGKAEFFQKYIMERFQKLQEQRSVATNTDAVESAPGPEELEVDPGDREEEDDLEAKTNIMIKEREIRDQIAEKFTLEIKTVEMNCAKRIKEMENENINNMTKLKQLVEKKAHEVETLKEFILSERSKVQQILNAKENEISVLIKEHNSLQQDFQNLKDKSAEYKQRIEKYQEKYRMVEEKYKSDRENSKKSIGEVEKEKQALHTKLMDLETELQTLKAKYKNAKKTAYMYKEYIAKKDEHVSGELSRIRSEYKDIFVKLQGQLNYLVNCRMQEQGGSGQERSDYTEMINRLQNDITTLAQSRYDDPADLRGT